MTNYNYKSTNYTYVEIYGTKYICFSCIRHLVMRSWISLNLLLLSVSWGSMNPYTSLNPILLLTLDIYLKVKHLFDISNYINQLDIMNG